MDHQIEDMLKKVSKMDELLQGALVLGKDALFFIVEKDLVEEFFEFHAKREQEKHK